MNIANPYLHSTAPLDLKHRSLKRWATIASLSVATVLIVLKFLAYMVTDSVSMLSSLMDSAFDGIASIATMVSVAHAATPADEDHRFGHGKAEALSAMFQVTLISISALGLAAQSIGQYLAGARTTAATEGIAVSIAAMVATALLLGWQRHVIRRTGSLAIATDHVHYQSDLLVNAAVIAELALDQYAGIAGVDPLLGLAIAVWLGWGAWRASQRAIGQLMDSEWPQEKKDRFIAVLARHPELKGVHDLRTRTAGNRDFVQFHVWVDPNMSLGRAHRIMDEIEVRLAAEFPDTEILIHPEPEGLMDQEGLAAEELLPSDDEA